LGAAIFAGSAFPVFSASSVCAGPGRQGACPPGRLPAWPQEGQAAPGGVSVDAERQYLQKAPVPVTAQAARPSEGAAESWIVKTYSVQPGDTIYGLAEKFGVTAQTLVWANNLSNIHQLAVDLELRIPPTSGVLHTVRDGDTLSSIAQKYRAATEEILGYKGNALPEPDALVLGQEIMVPGGVKPVEAPIRLASAAPSLPLASAAVASLPAPDPGTAGATGSMIWPTHGPIYNWFSGYHRGMDISPPYGTPVVASDGGVVVGNQYLRYGLGYHIVLDHGNGYQTVYAHLSQILVQYGQRVGRGEMIGRVGVTGYATGPHLHFEVHQYGVPVNPLNFLPR